MKILITGATGLVGKELVKTLLEKGYNDLHILTRNPKSIPKIFNAPIKAFEWDPYENLIDEEALRDVDAIGIEKATVVAICIDDKKTINKIAELIKHEFPQIKILARAYDRIHARELEFAEVDFHIRETFESAMRFGEEALRAAEVSEDEVINISEDIRLRDKERFQAEVCHNDILSGKPFLHSNLPKPEPLIKPKQS